MGGVMGKVAKLRRKVRRLKRENLALIIEANAARVRAGQANEKLTFAELSNWDWVKVPLDG